MIKEGDSIDREKLSVSLMRERLQQIPGVSQATISMICCDETDGGWIMYVGVSESASTTTYAASPTGNDSLPASLMQLGDQFMGSLMEAVQAGDAEDDSKGYSLSHNKKLRVIQDEFIVFAKRNFPLLQRVVRRSSKADHRALAAQVIAYAPDRKKVIGELLHAVNDNDEGVRNNATRALALLARYVSKNPGSGLKIPPEPFIEMLNSLSWTDRNKSMFVLWPLTETRDKKLLLQLKRQALPSLVEMAQWKNTGHAGTALIMLGRIADVPEPDIMPVVDSPNRKIALQTWIERIQNH